MCPKCKSPYWNKPRKKTPKEFIDEMVKTIIGLHDSIISTTGGEFGVRNEGGIYFSTYSLLNYKSKNTGNPTKLGSFILNEFAKKHHFMDGNKRTAYLLCKTMMLVNRCHLFVDYSEAVDFIVNVAKYESELSLQDIKRWLDKNCHIINQKDIRKHLNNILVELIIYGEKNE